MTRTVIGALLGAAVCVWAQAPAGDAKLEFEVASVKPSAPPGGGPMRVGFSGGPGTKDPTRAVGQNMSLTNLVSMAYDLKPFQLTGPDWMGNQRFDIQVNVPEGATREQFRVMLQNLLIERFKMQVHRESKEMPIYQLLVAKGGPKLKEAGEEPPPAPGEGPRIAPGPPKLDAAGFPVLPAGGAPMTMMMNGRARMRSRSTMEQLATTLSFQVGRPVTDGTGLKGRYEFEMYWALDRMGGMPPPPPPPGGPTGEGAPAVAHDDAGPTIYSALQEQLGLRLEAKKGPVEILVVDRMEKVPTEN